MVWNASPPNDAITGNNQTPSDGFGANSMPPHKPSLQLLTLSRLRRYLDKKHGCIEKIGERKNAQYSMCPKDFSRIQK